MKNDVNRLGNILRLRRFDKIKFNNIIYFNTRRLGYEEREYLYDIIKKMITQFGEDNFIGIPFYEFTNTIVHNKLNLGYPKLIILA